MRKLYEHTDIIKAWEDGAEIERYQEGSGKWVRVVGQPQWLRCWNYRIKPQPTSATLEK